MSSRRGNTMGENSEKIAPLNGYGNVMTYLPSLPEPAFEDDSTLTSVWGERWGISNDIGKIRVILVKRPGDEMKTIDESRWDPDLGVIIERDRYYWRSRRKPDLEKLQAQHDAITTALKNEGIRVEYIENTSNDTTKSIFTRDPAIVVKGGAIVGRMARQMRRGEERRITQKMASLGMPILHTIHGTGLLEGASFAWLDEENAALALSVAGNEEGARQVGEVLKTQGVNLITVDNHGYDIHIDGAIVMIDRGRALIDSSGLPYWFTKTLRDLKIDCIEKHPDDDGLGVNCLAVEPGKLLMASIAEKTIRILEKEGITVIPVDVGEIAKNGGGIHCSTLPLIRDPL
jgi:N-dimethylarginine dimethylaminohydrolase